MCNFHRISFSVMNALINPFFDIPTILVGFQVVKMKKDVPLSVLKMLQQSPALVDPAVHQSPEVSSKCLLI